MSSFVLFSVFTPVCLLTEKGPEGMLINNTGREALLGPPESFMNLSGSPYGQGNSLLLLKSHTAQPSVFF